MDEQPSTERGPGGNVEPLDRGYRDRKGLTVPEERFELHDARTELTYRMRTFVDMVTKANQIGALRFSAIAPDGKRSTVSKIDGTWRRDDLDPRTSTPAEKKPERAISTDAPPSLAPSQASAKDGTDAERAARRSQIEAALNERYVIKQAPIRIGDVTIGQTEYRHRGDISRIAFTESTFRLSTDNNNPSVARSMVDVAEARGWQSLRVSGNADFRRMVWFESSLRGVMSVGYEPVPADLDLLQKERQARHNNRIERLQGGSSPSGASSPGKQSERGGGRKAVLAALEAVLVAKNVPERQREAIMAAAADNLKTRLRNGETHRIKVYDRTAPSQRPVVTPARELQRDRDRSAPAR